MIDRSILPQHGGLSMKGDVQLMSLKYLLRQGTRRYGTRYEDAANTLVDLHNMVGLPQNITKQYSKKQLED